MKNARIHPQENKETVYNGMPEQRYLKLPIAKKFIESMIKEEIQAFLEENGGKHNLIVRNIHNYVHKDRITDCTQDRVMYSGHVRTISALYQNRRSDAVDVFISTKIIMGKE